MYTQDQKLHSNKKACATLDKENQAGKPGDMLSLDNKNFILLSRTNQKGNSSYPGEAWNHGPQSHGCRTVYFLYCCMCICIHYSHTITKAAKSITT